jgi:type I restriction enzyme, S subunit
VQVKLSDLCNITMGQSPKSIYYNKEGSGTPFMQGCTTFGRLFPSIDTWTTSYNKLANPNDILFTVRAPVGDINIALTKIAIGRGLAALKPTSVSTKYLYYLLLSNRDLFTNNSSGTVYDSINKSALENITLNIHSKNQQLLIVDIIAYPKFLLLSLLILDFLLINLLVHLIQFQFVLLLLLLTFH